MRRGGDRLLHPSRRDAQQTRETSAHDAKNRVKIADVCADFNTPCKQPFPVYRELGLELA
jgi:hypothetical protein